MGIRLLIGLLLPLAFRPFTGAAHKLQDRFRSLGKSDWEIVDGVIHSLHISSIEALWKVTVLYSYSAHGEYWSGEFFRTFATEGDADAYVSLHPANSPLKVRCCPGKPDKSFALAEDQRMVSPNGTI